MAKDLEGRKRGRPLTNAVAAAKAHPIYSAQCALVQLKAHIDQIVEWDRETAAFGRATSQEARSNLRDAWCVIEAMCNQAIVAATDIKAAAISGRYTPLGGRG